MAEVEFKRSSLSNGIQVLTERRSQTRALSIGVWVTVGTRDEKKQDMGLSHFLEHLVFKGTKKRSAFQLAQELESVGGDLNAYTTKEYTNYHCTVLKEDWEIGIDVLADLVCNMQLKSKDLEIEKGVILQEIAMSEEQYEDIIYDYFYAHAYDKNPLAYPILGTVKTIAGVNKKKIDDYYNKRYSASNILISASGDINHDEFCLKCETLFKSKKKSRIKDSRRKPKFHSFRKHYEKKSEQAHLLVGFEAPGFKSPYRFEAFIVNSLLGGGMTSTLYQIVRERKGLAYSVYSSFNTQIDCGLISIYAGCDPKNVSKVYRLIIHELKRLRQKGITQKQLDSFKKQVTGSILLGSEDVESRMTSLGVNEMVFSKYRPVDLVIAEIDRISLASVNTWIREEMFDNSKSIEEQLGIVSLGPAEPELKV